MRFLVPAALVALSSYQAARADDVLNDAVSDAFGKSATYKMSILFIIFHYFIPPIIIVVVVCPTGPHPQLRLGRRPNRGHIGGGGLDPLLRYMPMIFFISSGFSTSTLVNVNL